MALPIPSPLVFTVTTQKTELVTPAKPTPHEIKELSDMDDQKVLRCHLPAIMFYRNSPSMGGKRDPVKVIREALAQTLVFYYPLAGHLKEEGPGGKLIVECAGQGEWFVEADADIRFQDFVEAEALFPPYRFLNQILYDVPGSSEILNAPLLLIQPPALTTTTTANRRSAPPAIITIAGFYHAYDNYMTYAFSHDELKPLARTFTDSLVELGNLKLEHLPQQHHGSALTLPCYHWGTTQNLKRAVLWLSENLTFDVDARIHLFECNIRVLGGLVSAHILATDSTNSLVQRNYKNQLLILPEDLRRRFLPAFDTPTGLPYAWINLK
ncbi:unnamed protein product [Camellia sinensis]